MSTTPGAPTHRSFPFGKLLVGVAAGFALALAFGAGALLAYEGQYSERIYPGVVVDDIDVSGLTRTQVIARLEAAMASYAGGAAVVSVDGTQVTIPYDALGRRADVESLVDQAMALGRTAGDPLGRAVGGVRSLSRRDPHRPHREARSGVRATRGCRARRAGQSRPRERHRRPDEDGLRDDPRHARQGAAERRGRRGPHCPARGPGRAGHPRAGLHDRPGFSHA